MVYAYSDLLEKARQWAQDAHLSGWISQQQFDLINDCDARSPDKLFDDDKPRPLIVGFFGGTGVGKSSLINRLAGKEIALTGVERPTSREVTLYYHESIALERLPDDLPLKKIKLAQHDREERKNVLWVDMPDMDSIEQENRALVLAWLPHIDVLVYVVSPERYRDNKAWRLLSDESSHHAWVFVLNQWDKGEPQQYQDFIKQLEKGGFQTPIIKRTSCVNDTKQQIEDEFTELEATIHQLGQENTIAHLQQRGERLRKSELVEKLQQLQQQMGQDRVILALQEQWRNRWQEAEDDLVQGFDWPIQRLATAYVNNTSHILEKNPATSLSNPKKGLWDDWAQSRLDDVLDELVIYADQKHLPVTPVRNSLAPVKNKADRVLHTQTELAVRQALANPGNKLQRFMLKFSALCAAILPLTAMGWVGYQVFDGYYDSMNDEQAYLGTDFAIHSVLLISMTWLIPFFIKKQFKPSLEKVAIKGLHKGLQAGLQGIGLQVENALSEIDKQRQENLENLGQLIEQSQQQKSTVDAESDLLTRMLSKK